MRRRGLLVGLVVVAAMVAAIGVAVRLGVGPLPDPQLCEATVGEHTARLNIDQAENASLISAIAVRRGLPARAASIALATAYQESKIINLDHGDRDSVGIFQQRPSQGWGTAEQLQDPVYATNAFYDALVKIKGYESMRITEAAQAVQRSGFPEAYEDHADDARALASALTGFSGDGQFTCEVRHRAAGEEADALVESGLTARAERVRVDVEEAFGDLDLGGFDPDGVSTGHKEGSAHYEGRAVDIFLRPVTPANKRTGWAIAYYLVAHAERLDVDHVIFDGMIWGAGRSEEGWRAYDPGDRPGDRAVLEHRDHVHVDVLD